jgi:hypothetical protein
MKNTLLILLVVSVCMAVTGSIYAGNVAKAPTVATLDSLSDKYEPVIFDHAKHVILAANCGACHHQHKNYGSLPCKECHSLDAAAFKNSVTNNFMSCRNCHGSYDPSNPGMPGLKTAYHQTCFQCHRGMGEIGASPAGCTIMCHNKKGTIARK